MSEIVIARDFTKYPGGRYMRHGKGSGEEFRDKLLLPALRRDEQVIVKMDGTSGYPASFIEEAFGGLLRVGVSIETLRQKLTLRAEDPAYTTYVDQAWEYMVEQAQRQQSNSL